MQPKPAQRSESLDALRGLAIIMMILSGSIPFGGALPGWMYHAQEPPPAHSFCPDIPGITWVDMVFPFFIFSMGAAIPFAVSSRLRKGNKPVFVLGHITLRWLALSLFAFLVYYIRPWNINAGETTKWLLCLTGFLLLSATFIKLPEQSAIKHFEKPVNIGAFIMLLVALLLMNRSGIINISFYDFDIIIMVLACISLFGGAVQLFSKGSVTILALTWLFFTIMYLFARMGNVSFVKKIWDYSPLPWLLSWEYLKYMAVLIPGIWAGNIIKKFYGSFSGSSSEEKDSASWIIAFIMLSVNIVIIAGLYLRHLMAVSIYSAVAFSAVGFIIRRWKSDFRPLIIKLLILCVILLFTGLLVEPLQGGIKKDPATISYLILTPGMALAMLIFFIIVIDLKKRNKEFSLFAGSGKNAMFAYFTGSNLVMPVLVLTGINSFVGSLNRQPLWQTIVAVIITLLTAWLSAHAARRRIFLKA